ncbi:glutamine ABC transporter substrate-binding protein GlnH [Desulfopila inferna]|uniref:glutamine ABC transporter substrate-binding protein GlnH n=1 Tax=Desulfopila inferna TaxID=468528 RepID=UPI00196241CA|nr:glutamine ABC transporter substrate-binding protein GlnH [Desulfopila inferna]MBM9603688.1 glutamine ABC transporter substrate-binding protein GlnH [Desulfopila inferna]
MRKSFLRRLLSTATAIAMLFVTVGFSAAAELRVGVDTAFVPFEFKGKDGKYTGFDVELWDAIAKRIDVDYELVPMDFNGLIPGLTTGNLDVVLAAIFITSEREKAIDFSHPYFRAGLKVMVPIDNTDINGPADLKGKVVAVKTGTATVPYAETLGVEKLTKFPNIDQAYLEVATGGADAAMHDTPNVLYYVKTAGEGRVKAVGADVKAAYYGIGLQQGSPLRDQVNIALLEMQEDGEYDQLYKKWFGTLPE